MAKNETKLIAFQMNKEYVSLESKTGHKENPKKNASLLSILSFWWVGEILAIGSKRPLDNDDLFPLLDEDKTQTSTEKLQETWSEETAKRVPGKQGNGYRLFRALVRMFPWSYHFFILSIFLLPGVCNVLQPVFLSLLLPELMNSSTEDLSWAYIYAAGICLSSLVRVIAAHQYAFHSYLMALRWKSGTIAIIFKKVLSLSQADISSITSGYVINLIASDLQRFELSALSIFLFVQALFELCGISCVISFLFGWKALTGILFMIIISLYYGITGRILTNLRSKISKVADHRINIMNSIISGIRAVKMYAWEWPFMERVQRIRREEIKLIRWKTVILATFASLMFSCQTIAAFISLVTLAATGTELSPFNTFMILSLVSTLRTTVAWNIAQPINLLADFAAALSRIQGILEFENGDIHKYLQYTFAKSGHNCNSSEDNLCKDTFVKGGKNHKFSEDNLCKANQLPRLDVITREAIMTHSPGNDPAVLLKNVFSSWTGSWNNLTLKSVSFSVEKSGLVFIAGPVGCGKTSLLNAILREIPLLDGKISCQGKIAWVSQQPWVFSGTVRDNILFGEAFDPDRYHKTLHACDLYKDLQRFQDGDMTWAGERGIVLSGGQRSRVELARAVYSNADIYLLDDPLSALDTNVGRHVFKTCVTELLRDKTRLISTHNLQVLREAENIVVMKNGSVIGEGNLPSLLQYGFDLYALEKFTRKHEAVTLAKKYPLIQDQPVHETTSDEEFSGLDNVDEDRVAGCISWKVYCHYIQAGICNVLSLVMVIFFFLVQGSLILPDWWLLQLSSRSHDPQHQTDDLYIYGYLVGGAFLLSVARAVVCLNVLINSSKNLHSTMISAVLKAPVLFFDTNSVGRILNRFSRDTGIMDELLPDVFLDSVQIVLFCIGAVILQTVLNPWIILPATPLVVVFALIGRYYLKSSRDLRRLEGVNRSPVLSHFSDTLEGLVTIRACKREDAFLETLYRYQDGHNKAWVSIISVVRWLGFRLDMICVVFLAFVVFLAVYTQAGSGVTALSIVYALQLALDTSQYGVKQCSEVENYMTSVERVITYTQIEPEPGHNNYQQPPQNWPQHGQVTLNDLGLVYYQGGPKILKDVSFTINSQEKIGIVGRTGAGKSSLVAALFRMPQPIGDVIIDDVNIANINIQSSRRAMAVITQNPVLFTGSLRMNLDPFDEYGDKELWEALEQASLKAMVNTLPRQLSEEVKECGANFSVGERQLLCLARALLKKNKIIVLDEATANVDHKTDQFIQETIRTKFKHCTVITIAHRLNTIMDYDRMLVLENGRVVEYDKPGVLLQNEGGQFSRLYECYADNVDENVRN